MSKWKPPSDAEMAARGLNPDGTPLNVTKVRARNTDGTLKGDNPDTPENEAWTTKVVKSVKKASPKKKKG